MMFPTGINAEHSFGEGQFDVVKRTTNRIDSKNWIEQPMYDYPLHHFVDLSDGKNGCAIIVSGLKEYEVLDDPHKTLALTLLRSFTYIIQPSSKQDYSHKKGSQCFGNHGYNISVYPHIGYWDEGKVYEQAFNFNNDLRIFQIGKTYGNLSPTVSFIQIDPNDLVFSCFKVSEFNDDEYILRIYNPTENKIDGRIKFLFEIKKAEIVTLEEKSVESIPITGHYSFNIEAGPKKIVTIKLSFIKLTKS